ncbi:hypothetical protein PBI_TREYKAY_86 [Mycobacterium phage TreyKay]|uniref:Uncharacterized protein n=1 Tax=Mycobacterium phage Prithvi TaxID=2484215 RepID=A0A3G3M2D6_9CAUD|nr:hypothetical protein I5H05_gp17 [Mycobacterium phage Prithvi]ASZ75155.1 hypothetical protein PBI_TREYKAY_86 [Mycobacterium phage TreyKay]AYR00348.1 hypothetical protein PBI_PRITHVI_86 [Mycobacterium phage Prithvi]
MTYDCQRERLCTVCARPSLTECRCGGELTPGEKLALIEAWMHPGLWSALDGRRNAILRILNGESVTPPDWAVTNPLP